MSIAKGSNSRLIITKEKEYGTTPSPPKCKLLAFKKEGLDGKRNLIDETSITGSRDKLRPMEGNIDVGGSVDLNFSPQLAPLVAAAMGNVTTTSNTSSSTHKFMPLDATTTSNAVSSSHEHVPLDVTTTSSAVSYTHVITIGNLPSYTIEKGFVDIGGYIVYHGLKANKMSLNCKPEGEQDFSVDFTGKDFALASTSIDTAPTPLGQTAFSGFRIASVLVNEKPAGLVSELSLDVENELDNSVYAIGSGGKRIEVPEGMAKVGGTLKLFFANTAILNKAISGATCSLKIAYQFGNGDGSAGNEYAELHVPELLFSVGMPSVDGPKGILASLNWQAFHIKGASSLVVTIKNQQETII